MKRRGSPIDPPNRFVPVHAERDFEHWEFEDPAEFEPSPQTLFFDDDSRSVISENDSPDVPFRYSLNPYRGCEHGCAYCYARPTHEYLGLIAGIDFESKIFVKRRAPELFREFLARDAWRPEHIAMSGVTDCYQPAERRFQITRGCLQVALAARQPIGIVTKNALVARDLDVLQQMAALRLVHVNISLTTLDAELARTMEPRTSAPAARLRAMRMLSDAGVPVRVMVAPIIPGLNDSEIPALLAAARDHGATSAGYVMLRLPLTVAPVFQDWLTRTQPTHRDRIEGLIRQTHNGRLCTSDFSTRMKGSGTVAEQIRNTFRLFTCKLILDQPLPEFDLSRFQPPQSAGGQLRLF
jgi:DNA repair photolyase